MPRDRPTLRLRTMRRMSTNDYYVMKIQARARAQAQARQHPALGELAQAPQRLEVAQPRGEPARGKPHEGGHEAVERPLGDGHAGPVALRLELDDHPRHEERARLGEELEPPRRLA